MGENVAIVSAGSYLPRKIVDNIELAKRLGVDANWITQRTGVLRRHVADSAEATSDMATIAAKDALKKANMDISQVDMILVSTSISDTTLPPTACRVHKNLGAKNIPAMDISASCSGFIYGLATAYSYINTGFARTILFVCSELRSKFVNPLDPDTASVYGDGAGAVILSAIPENADPTLNSQKGFLDISLGSDGSGSETITIPAGGTRLPATQQTVAENLHYIHFHDRTIIKSAVRGLKKHVEARLKNCKLTIDDIDVVVPHQMNLRMMDSISKRLSIPKEKFVINIDRCGNTSSASIPIALDEALSQKRIKTGDTVLFMAYGAGFTWGSAIYQF